jgi:hypothetical protein
VPLSARLPGSAGARAFEGLIYVDCHLFRSFAKTSCHRKFSRPCDLKLGLGLNFSFGSFDSPAR